MDMPTRPAGRRGGRVGDCMGIAIMIAVSNPERDMLTDDAPRDTFGSIGRDDLAAIIRTADLSDDDRQTAHALGRTQPSAARARWSRAPRSPARSVRGARIPPDTLPQRESARVRSAVTRREGGPHGR